MYADYIAELAEESPQLVFKKSVRKMLYVDNAFFVTFAAFAGRFLRGPFVILEEKIQIGGYTIVDMPSVFDLLFIWYLPDWIELMAFWTPVSHF